MKKICKRCKKKFKQKIDYIRHINRKNPCKIKIDQKNDNIHNMGDVEDINSIEIVPNYKSKKSKLSKSDNQISKSDNQISKNDNQNFNNTCKYCKKKISHINNLKRHYKSCKKKTEIEKN